MGPRTICERGRGRGERIGKRNAHFREGAGGATSSPKGRGAGTYLSKTMRRPGTSAGARSTPARIPPISPLIRPCTGKGALRTVSPPGIARGIPTRAEGTKPIARAWWPQAKPSRRRGCRENLPRARADSRARLGIAEKPRAGREGGSAGFCGAREFRKSQSRFCFSGKRYPTQRFSLSGCLFFNKNWRGAGGRQEARRLPVRRREGSKDRRQNGKMARQKTARRSSARLLAKAARRGACKRLAEKTARQLSDEHTLRRGGELRKDRARGEDITKPPRGARG